MAAMPDNQVTPTPMSPQERMARESLAQGRFRRARDEFKVLCKVRVLEIEMDAPSDKGAPPVPDILGMLAKPGRDETERQRLADRAVLAFAPVPNPPSLGAAGQVPEIAALAGELEAIVTVLAQE